MILLKHVFGYAHKTAFMRNILVVDDSPTIRRMVLASLRGMQGVSFQEAGTGLEAIERLALGPVNLMVVDLNMPDMHGLELLRFVRQNDRFQSIPVIILTTKSDEESRRDAMHAGATAYMTKPFEPARLVEQAKAILEGP
jgi:two-component system chemotaxis response regulator CheY